VSLSLEPNILRAIVSTPSCFKGQFSTSDLVMQIAFPGDDAPWETRTQPGPYSRCHFLVSLRIPDDPTSPTALAAPATTLRDGQTHYAYGAVLEKVADLAAVWFGKRFDYHGLVIDHAIAYLPRLDAARPMRHHSLGPYNHIPRPDLHIELTLNNLHRVRHLLYLWQPAPALGQFWTATRFYARALRAFDNDPETAFFDLMVALEVLASETEMPESELYDAEALSDLEQIEDKLGKELAARVRDRYKQVSRRVRWTVRSLVDDRFFAGSADIPEVYRLTQANLDAYVKNAYDLRSKYVHIGVPFGAWIAVTPEAEVQFGTPVLAGSDHKLQTLLGNIPTFVGLERLTRFVILRFAQLHLPPLHSAQD